MEPVSLMPYGCGCVTVLASKVTAVCANSLPFIVAPVFRVIAVCDSITPSMCAVVSRATTPKDCQKMFLGSAPPVKITFVAEAWVIPCAYLEDPDIIGATIESDIR